MSVKALLFDVDGVLVDTEEWHRLATSIAAGRYVDCSGGGSTQCKLRRAGFSEEEIARIYELKRLHYASFVQKAIPNPDLLQALQVASRRYVLAACSNSSKESCLDLLRRVKVLPYLSSVVTGGDVSRLKPAPDVYSETLRRLQLCPQEVVVFEDSVEGEQSARAAEIPIVVRCSTQTLIEEIRKWL